MQQDGIINAKNNSELISLLHEIMAFNNLKGQEIRAEKNDGYLCSITFKKKK